MHHRTLTKRLFPYTTLFRSSDTVPTNAGLGWSIDAGGTTGTWALSGRALEFTSEHQSHVASVCRLVINDTTAATCGTVFNSATSRSSHDSSPSAGPVALSST